MNREIDKKKCSGRKWHRRQNRYIFGIFPNKMAGYIVTIYFLQLEFSIFFLAQDRIEMVGSISLCQFHLQSCSYLFQDQYISFYKKKFATLVMSLN